MLDATRRLILTVKALARDGRIPKPLRGLVAFGLMPIPGPFDEAVLLIAGVILFAFYRGSLREAWKRPANSVTLNPQASRGFGTVWTALKRTNQADVER